MELTIKVSPRNERGRQNKKIRKNKRVPAVVYGKGQKNLSFSMDIRSAEKYSTKKYENKIFTLDSEDEQLKGLKVIKKALSRHKVSGRPLHLDFLSLDMTKALRVPVDIHFKGLPKGVKEEGGIFNIILRNLEIECLPNEIPPAIDLDVSQLTLNQSIHVEDLKLPKNLKRITKGKRTICTLVPAKEEEEKKAEEPGDDSALEGKSPPSEKAEPKKDSK